VRPDATSLAPAALGVRITGVDDSCFSQTGESYSMITMPNADTHVARTLQEDNTELVRTGCACACACACTTLFPPPVRALNRAPHCSAGVRV
tara:strand:+ start:287 stop:562 length:276 start_codon:yes stop_codon:yes gene_type:complete